MVNVAAYFVYAAFFYIAAPLFHEIPLVILAMYGVMVYTLHQIDKRFPCDEPLSAENEREELNHIPRIAALEPEASKTTGIKLFFGDKSDEAIRMQARMDVIATENETIKKENARLHNTLILANDHMVVQEFAMDELKAAHAAELQKLAKHSDEQLEQENSKLRRKINKLTKIHKNALRQFKKSNAEPSTDMCDWELIEE